RGTAIVLDRDNVPGSCAYKRALPPLNWSSRLIAQVHRVPNCHWRRRVGALFSAQAWTATARCSTGSRQSRGIIYAILFCNRFKTTTACSDKTFEARQSRDELIYRQSSSHSYSISSFSGPSAVVLRITPIRGTGRKCMRIVWKLLLSGLYCCNFCRIQFLLTSSNQTAVLWGCGKQVNRISRRVLVFFPFPFLRCCLAHS
ncbi:hypothetical protein DFH11DRAFT_1600230, partial [Phellopilus nigrolimitatus]